MTTYLLDANVLIALVIREHEHHMRAATWLGGVDRFAVCPIVEGALVRFVLRMGESVDTARALLAGVHGHARCDFWPDDLAYPRADLDGVRGHRQVTDFYLASLAASKGGRLATLDQGLARARPEAVSLIPAEGATS